MIMTKDTITAALDGIKKARKALKHELFLLQEEEALFNRLKRALDGEATPEEIEGLELEELRFIDKAIKVLKEAGINPMYTPKHETKGMH